jgi:hypothetical protein
MSYNLPPNKCLKEGFIFFALVILGPKEPKKQMNIFLHPLMEELKELWQGVDANGMCFLNVIGLIQSTAPEWLILVWWR